MISFEKKHTNENNQNTKKLLRDKKDISTTKDKKAKMDDTSLKNDSPNKT